MSGTGSPGQSPAPLYSRGLARKENAKPGLNLYADGQQSVSSGRPLAPPPRSPWATRPPVNLFADLTFALVGTPRAASGPIPPWGNPQPRFTPSRPRSYRIKVAMGLYHYRFLERAIVLVSIATLWQIGYTVNHNVRVGQIRPDERYKKGAMYRRPERARISWGKPCEVGVRGRDLSYRARGRCHSDTFACANSQSGIVGKPKATRSLDPIPPGWSSLPICPTAQSAQKK